MGTLIGVIFLVCVVVPMVLWMFFGAVSAISQISGTGWVLILAAILAICVIAAGAGYGVWYLRNQQREMKSSEDEEDEEDED
jgi:membrane protein YdbS with pleckstrin-like domain